jgi:hypothetical protein
MSCVCHTGLGYWRVMECRPFTPREEARARRVGEKRHLRSTARGSVDSVSKKDKAKDLAVHIMGARAELAWCILEGVKWSASVDNFHKPDVEPDIEIRCRNWRWKNLIIRDRDLVPEKLDRRFVAARERRDGTIEFNGWVTGRQALRYPKRDPGGYGKPARFIDVEYLHKLPFYRDFPKKHQPRKEDA